MSTVVPVETSLEEAYGAEPPGRLHGCPACSVTWFGDDDRCWVCGDAGAGPVVVVPPNGSHSWSSHRCEDAADAEETAVFLRRVTARS